MPPLPGRPAPSGGDPAAPAGTPHSCRGPLKGGTPLSARGRGRAAGRVAAAAQRCPRRPGRAGPPSAAARGGAGTPSAPLTHTHKTASPAAEVPPPRLQTERWLGCADRGAGLAGAAPRTYWVEALPVCRHRPAPARLRVRTAAGRSPAERRAGRGRARRCQGSAVRPVAGAAATRPLPSPRPRRPAVVLRSAQPRAAQHNAPAAHRPPVARARGLLARGLLARVSPTEQTNTSIARIIAQTRVHNSCYTAPSCLCSATSAPGSCCRVSPWLK